LPLPNATPSLPALRPLAAAVLECGIPAKAQGRIDELVFAQQKTHGVLPASLSSDEVFLRRIFLDLLGILPTVQEATAFLTDNSPHKRAQLIDHLLLRDEFATYRTMQWGDLLRIKSEFPINLWPTAAQEYTHWVRDSLAEKQPFDQFARALLTASGSNFRVGAANFYRAVQSRDAQTLAQSVALTFMGVRLEKWPAKQRAQMAAFFSQVGYKSTGEWKEEIVFFDSAKPAPSSPLTLPDGKKAELQPGQDPRELFAEWLIRPENPYFARAICNRIWNWLTGRGVIDPVDDMRADNLPSIPGLLEFLQSELVRSNWNLLALYRLILNSSTWQLGPVPRSKFPDSTRFFASYAVRRLPAEVLIDALCQATGSSEQYFSATPEPYTILPAGQSAVALPDGGISSAFLELFGRSPRDTGLNEERNNLPSPSQRLHLLNSTHMENMIEKSSTIQAILKISDPRAAIAALYLNILSRYPAEDELKTATNYAKSAGLNHNQSLVDLAWALFNSAEFVNRH